ncbi:hypothetical protein D1007_33695 [Hordeum vulgare]|nr:hypothetical protein D1007_33695 [Hordeum vulgare]
MADARRVRAERRATRTVQIALAGAAGARRSPSLVVNATAGPEAQEQQGSSQPVTKAPMADARRVHTERRATLITQTALVGAAAARRSPSPMVDAATGPEAQEQQGSSQPATKPINGRTTTPSLARPSGSASRA